MAIRGQNILDDSQSVSHTVQGRKTLLLLSVLGNRTVLASLDTDWFFFNILFVAVNTKGCMAVAKKELLSKGMQSGKGEN